MKIEDLQKYNKILIVGYGIEGESAASFLKTTCPHIEIGIADKKDGENYLDKQADYELAIRSPGVNKKYITIPYTTPTNIFFANAKAPIVGVTGTKGKSTTTSLVYAMLKEGGYDARLCGNIGKPMLDELMKPVNDKTVYVTELSSYQLDDIRYSPHVALLINLFPEHMDYHGSFELYSEAKKNIARYQNDKDVLVYNSKFPSLEEFAKSVKSKIVPIGEDLPFDRGEIPLMGAHNVQNVMAAYTVAKEMGVSDEAVLSAVKKFKALPHRLEFVGNFLKPGSRGEGGGIDFYDDAISTTPESTIEAILAVHNTETIFLGGTDRGYDFRALAEKILESNIKNIVLFPDSGDRIKKSLNDKCESSNIKRNLNFFETRDMKEAVEWAYKVTREGKAVLLSCASPSYSVWKNFEEKGDLFKQCVRVGSESKSLGDRSGPLRAKS